MRILIFFVSFILLPFFLYSGRPLTTEDSGIVEKNRFEIEMGVEASKDINNISEQNIDYSIKYGISDRMDVGFAFSQEINDTVTFTSLEISFKFLFYNNGLFLPHISFIFTTIPGDSAYEVKVVFSKYIKKFAFHLNNAYLINPVNKNIQINSSLAVEFLLNNRFNIVSEVCFDNMKQSFNNVSITYLIGGNFQIKRGIILDIGIDTSLNKESKYSLITGVTFNF